MSHAGDFINAESMEAFEVEVGRFVAQFDQCFKTERLTGRLVEDGAWNAFRVVRRASGAPEVRENVGIS